jgi:hypothetical protein
MPDSIATFMDWLFGKKSLKQAAKVGEPAPVAPPPDAEAYKRLKQQADAAAERARKDKLKGQTVADVAAGH